MKSFTTKLPYCSEPAWLLVFSSEDPLLSGLSLFMSSFRFFAFSYRDGFSDRLCFSWGKY